MTVLYQPLLLCRKYQSDIMEVVYCGETYYENYDDAEDDAFDARSHPKERVVIREHVIP